jgi:16S rRNA (cytosine1402-N4)-methyltransferase
MHVSVLLKETVDLVVLRPEGRYVDGTLGMGGHAEAILKRLQPAGRLLGLDVDPAAIQLAERRLQPFGERAITRLANFRGLPSVLKELGWGDVDGMVFDLGISSQQLDDPARGLSFRSEAPLDMRIDPANPETALSFLRKVDEKEFADLLFRYGEARNARRLARAICFDVSKGLINTTGELARLCERVAGRHGKTHPATRVFLALRASVNDEMGALNGILKAGPSFLSVGGRMAVITFQSIEDKAVKERFRGLEDEGMEGKTFRRITRKPLAPSEDEARENPRARSAKLRVLERVS